MLQLDHLLPLHSKALKKEIYRILLIYLKNLIKHEKIQNA